MQYRNSHELYEATHLMDVPKNADQAWNKLVYLDYVAHRFHNVGLPTNKTSARRIRLRRMFLTYSAGVQ